MAKSTYLGGSATCARPSQISPRLRAATLALGLFAAIHAAPAQAYEGDYGSASSGFSGGDDFHEFRGAGRGRDHEEAPYDLSVAGGISAPSLTASFGENPAGLIYNRRPKVLGFIASGSSNSGGQSPDLFSNGASVYVGDGNSAGTIGVQSYNNATDSGGGITLFRYGMATFVPGLNTAFGIDGTYRFTKTSQAIAPELQKSWSADLGFLTNPYGDFRWGLEVYDVAHGVSAYGTGISLAVNPTSNLALDASTNSHGQGLTVKPGIGVRADHMQISYAYGIQVDKQNSSGISPGNTLGLGYEFNPTFRLNGYYNAFALYSLGATVSF